MREVLANPGSHGYRIFDRRAHVGGTLHVFEALMDGVGDGLHESGDRAAALLFAGGDEFIQIGQVRNVFGGGDKIVELLQQLVMLLIQIVEGGAVGDSRGFVGENYAVGLDLQMPVLRKHVELMHPIAESVAIGSRPRGWRSSQAEREATLLV